MTLDLSSRELRFRINRNSKEIIFDNVTTGEDVRYCMAIDLGRERKEQIQLVKNLRWQNTCC